jgi:hypothetical protein
MNVDTPAGLPTRRWSWRWRPTIAAPPRRQPQDGVSDDSGVGLTEDTHRRQRTAMATPLRPHGSNPTPLAQARQDPDDSDH